MQQDQPRGPRVKTGDEPFDYGEKLPDGQHAAHPIAPADQRATKVRPVRDRYKHVGIRPKYPTRPLTPEEVERHNTKLGCNYVAYEQYPPEMKPMCGRFWTEAQLKGGCGVVTRMPQAIAETYAAQPGYYGSTFCVGCGKYMPVGADGEFVWMDENGRETTERVGT